METVRVVRERNIPQEERGEGHALARVKRRRGRKDEDKKCICTEYMGGCSKPPTRYKNTAPFNSPRAGALGLSWEMGYDVNVSPTGAAF